MPNYDLRPIVDVRSGDGQLYHSEGVTPDEFYNCVWEGVRIAARSLGAGEPYDDEQLRHIADGILNRPPNHYGEQFTTAAQVIANCYPSLKAWTEQPSDIVAALEAHIAQGHIVELGFYCDTQANVPPQGPITYSHNEILLAFDTDKGIATFGNVEPHPTYALTTDQIRSLWDTGGILVITKEGDVTPELFETLARIAYKQIRPTGIGPQELSDRLAWFGTGKTDAEVRDAIRDIHDSPEGQAQRDVLNELEADAPALDKLAKNPPAAGPQGPQGPKGDPGPQGPAAPAPAEPSAPADATSGGGAAATLIRILAKLLGA